MSNNCVECNKEFIQFKTGHTVLCDECHSKIINSITIKSEDDLKKENLKKVEIIKIDKPLTPKNFIESEKYYHSVHFHSKFKS